MKHAQPRRAVGQDQAAQSSSDQAIAGGAGLRIGADAQRKDRTRSFKPCDLLERALQADKARRR
jgi:hypothetical protein